MRQYISVGPTNQIKKLSPNTVKICILKKKKESKMFFSILICRYMDLETEILKVFLMYSCLLERLNAEIYLMKQNKLKHFVSCKLLFEQIT